MRETTVAALSTLWSGIKRVPEADAVYSAVRVRMSLQPRQIAHIDNADNSSLNLQCGDGPANLAIVGEFIAARVAE